MPRVRTLFLSDIHLGTRACQADRLLDFLREYSAERTYLIGDIGYEWLVRLNLWLSWIRRKLGKAGYWSLAGYAKRKVKTAVNFIFDFEDSVIRAVRERGLDGVICGHIHSATLRRIDQITYINCGDWVDSCSAVVEHLDGRMELIHHGAVLAPVRA